MKKEKEVSPIYEYFRLQKVDRNMFSVETVKVQDGKIIETLADEATYLPIAFDKMRRKTAEQFFEAVQNA